MLGNNPRIDLTMVLYSQQADQANKQSNNQANNQANNQVAQEESLVQSEESQVSKQASKQDRSLVEKVQSQASKHEDVQVESDVVFDLVGVSQTSTLVEHKRVVRRVQIEPRGGDMSQGTRAKPHDEVAYLDLVEKTIQQGTFKPDRTGVGTLSLFGAQMRFDLAGGTLPLLTTKKMAWKSIAHELLWFISGDTNANTLSKKKVRIWDANATREFLDSRGLFEREQGDLGPVYGFQWRHFGAEYKDMHSDYTNQGVDQLAQVLHLLKTDPSSRRIIMTAWNPKDLDKMALPPCHMNAQFYVSNNKLSCKMTQRSADMGLGVPFNIASYALLTHILAWATNLEPGEFIHSIGDCHVYLNHIEPLLGQLQRHPKPFPKLRITNDTKDIDRLPITDFQVVDYDSWPPIKMQMAV
jgi:thymidylate synthase